MEAVVTSIRVPVDVKEQYETLARATGRTRNDLMVDALRVVAERRLRDIALIQEGLTQIRAGRTIAVEDVVTEFKRDGILAADFTRRLSCTTCAYTRILPEPRISRKWMST